MTVWHATILLCVFAAVYLIAQRIRDLYNSGCPMCGGKTRHRDDCSWK
jgi:hypothetical protein